MVDENMFAAKSLNLQPGEPWTFFAADTSAIGHQGRPIAEQVLQVSLRIARRHCHRMLQRRPRPSKQPLVFFPRSLQA
jgi:hypothetical protein